MDRFYIMMRDKRGCRKSGCGLDIDNRFETVWYHLSVSHSNAIVTGGVLAMCVIATACLDPCENKILYQTVAPGNKRRAILFERGCGATMGVSTHLSVIDRSGSPPGGAGNVFIADSNHGEVALEIHIHWASSDHLVVDFPAPARVFQKRTSVSGVQISYHAYGVR